MKENDVADPFDDHSDASAQVADLSGLSVDPGDYDRGPGKRPDESGNMSGGPDGADCPEGSADSDNSGGSDDSSTGLSDLSAEELVADIRRNISCIAFCHARVLALIDEVDQRGLWAQWIGVTSLTQWVMHIAAVSAHTAREYVRVMTALREMPKVKESLGSGDVSFSKVREITRLVGRIPDEDALKLATVATGSQIGVVAHSYCQLSDAIAGGEIPRFLPADSVSMRTTGPGRTRITIDLGEDEAAEIFSMLEAARHLIEQESGEGELGSSTETAATAAESPASDDSVFGSPAAEGKNDFLPIAVTEPEEKPPYEPISQVMCLMEIIHAFPRAESAGTVDVDRARMLVHASAEVVTHAGTELASADVEGPDLPGAAEPTDVPFADVPAGTTDPSAVPAGVRTNSDVPAGTSADGGTTAHGGTVVDGGTTASASADMTCRIDGFGGIAPETAERLTCEALISGAIKAADGDVLMLGRSKRLVSRRQRLALSARDIGCQFPGCRARRRCDAHHIRPWSQGGATDMDNLILLCRTHHTAVHKYQLTISRTDARFAGALEGRAAFAFFLPDGSEMLPLEQGQAGRPVFDTARLVKVAEEAVVDADPSTLGGGYGFNLDNCVDWMFEAEWRHARANNAAA
ncbi:HNH endonuclease signature motif containing protein [Brevibacterium sp. ZH18]|uniref:HNH endonuclease signature motif containing protein n=1 Tax=Brevibacterium sp. ZH18 TaxID=2927784 RepID=UPI001F60169A|nr:HNH endonuclease signature motif containing protein [Brevibacterium sp. ZH18]MCI4010512.1 HNH endonuclease [Brevibacterium sp. ZH18]